ncbi:ATP-dependent Lon protease [Acetitomaculum ruminis DSM 5522]|uniref:endopeptidase La n=1 Tax=Acetitomaculum ruminis DSM 5522 TaxID=1120918 RepID=A0A1I0Y1M3_9FIRM|nr:endopeptidase La [Acetitomaculum ruminis]SFB06777.1 ATP-dependent Lon protease [Acetitomaculum ruminis DSM 5522]
MHVKIFYDILLMPTVGFYFNKENFEEDLDKVVKEGDELLFLLQKEDKDRKKLVPEDIYDVAVTGVAEKITMDGNVHIKIKDRVKVKNVKFGRSGKCTAEYELLEDIDDISQEEEDKIFRELHAELIKFVKKCKLDMRVLGYVLHMSDLTEIVCSLVPYLNLKAEEKYEIMSLRSKKERFIKLRDVIYEFMDVYEIGEEATLAERERQSGDYQKHVIKRQIDYLQKKLDELNPEDVSDIEMFEKKIAESGMNDEAKNEATKILNRMKQEGQDGHEYGIHYDYLDFVTSLSWKKEEMKEIDLNEAQKILDSEHYGLKKVKDRIIEQLAVMALNKTQSGSILLFVGAPGTGKTSLGQSIAKALGREYVRISLGGIRDEAEIRGHRRTYVGAMPGRIMEGIKRSKSSNPVMVLDEVDKLMKDYGGDPASALLEVLDPEQNNTFTDHYMNVPYDLSDVLFICTANSTDTIPEPLLNRMEVIPFTGYSPTEKFNIAREHLLKRAMKEVGIKSSYFKITDEALRKIIEGYTAESGVRGLKKQIDIMCRHVAVKYVKKEQKTFTINENKLKEYLGKNPIEKDKPEKKTKAGIVTGLAWTSAGGDILFIETAFTKGTGKVIITGKLGDVMKESVQIAISLVKMIYPSKAGMFEKNDLHVHVPAGAVPKDGPSAGITLVSALSSLVNNKAVDPFTAMTGEVSLRGGVMPIGGLPEKLMAAQRAGVKRVFIPEKNLKDLEEVAEEVKTKLEIIPVKTVKEVVKKVVI